MKDIHSQKDSADRHVRSLDDQLRVLRDKHAKLSELVKNKDLADRDALANQLQEEKTVSEGLRKALGVGAYVSRTDRYEGREARQ